MDKPLEFILVPKCPLFGDSTVHRIDGCIWSYQLCDDRGMWWYQSCEMEVREGQGGFEQTRILLTQQVLFPRTFAVFEAVSQVQSAFSRPNLGYRVI